MTHTLLADVTSRSEKNPPNRNGQLPFDAYTLYYVGQALYQVGDPYWKESYPLLRDYLIKSQRVNPDKPDEHGRWEAGGHVGGNAGELYGTSVACFVLAMPNRYLPILQEGKILYQISFLNNF